MNTSSEEDIDIQDGDSCPPDEINKLFNVPLNLSTEEAISLKKNYILHLDVSQYEPSLIFHIEIILMEYCLQAI